MKDWLLNHLPESLVTAFASLVGWIAHRAITKVDAQEARIRSLEESRVKREDLEDLREAFNATLTHSLARIESRTDEILLHLAERERR
jgi:hypothetical protein